MATKPQNTHTQYVDYSWPYLKAIAFMAVIGIVAIFAITLIRPNADDVVVIGSVVGFMTPSTLALLALMKSQETHLSVNSRLDKMLEHAERASRSEGMEAGRTAQKDEDEVRRVEKEANGSRQRHGRA